jgi:hypothetical protein
MEYLINIANTLYLFSYFVRDVLWLRVLTVIAATCLTVYFYFRPDPLMTVVYWNLFFIALNVYWVFRLWLERGGYSKVRSSLCFGCTVPWRVCLTLPSHYHVD